MLDIKCPNKRSKPIHNLLREILGIVLKTLIQITSKIFFVMITANKFEFFENY